MTNRTFEQQRDNVYLWVDICNHHWDRLLGEFQGDREFWQDLFHSMEAQDWQDVVTIAKALQIAHPELLRTFKNYEYSLEEIERRLHKQQPVIKPWNTQRWNNTAVSLFLCVRDSLNELQGTPTKRWTDKERQQIRNTQAYDHFTKLFDLKQD